jgi:transposase
MQVYGIDLSMESFDIDYIDQNGKQQRKQVKNRLNGIWNFLTTVPKGSVLCAEHTGCYGDLLLFLSNQMGVPIALVPGFTIKHSLGLIKGKSDPMDAKRIREFGERFYDKLDFKVFNSDDIAELKSLYALRSQLVKARKLIKTGNHSRTKAPMQSIAANRITEASLSDLTANIKDIEQTIEMIIRQNPELFANYKLLTSIVGIGPVIAIDMIIKTGNFQVIDTARKAASYAGVCPFPNASGKMVGKSKTSPHADKQLKSLLYMGAKAAAKHNKEYRLYYQKKQMEGKPHYLIMNNISNKLLRVMYSIVKSREEFKKDYICLDPREREKNNSSIKKVA